MKWNKQKELEFYLIFNYMAMVKIESNDQKEKNLFND